MQKVVQLDKYNDPEYREKKRLKKEKRREQHQQLMQQQELMQQQPPEMKQEPDMHEEETEKPLEPDRAKVPAADSLQAKPATSSSEKAVVRLKIKRMPQPQHEPMQEPQLSQPQPAPAPHQVESDMHDESDKNVEHEPVVKAGNVDFLQPRPPTSAPDKVVRLKIKRM